MVIVWLNYMQHVWRLCVCHFWQISKFTHFTQKYTYPGANQSSRTVQFVPKSLGNFHQCSAYFELESQTPSTNFSIRHVRHHHPPPPSTTNITIVVVVVIVIVVTTENQGIQATLWGRRHEAVAHRANLRPWIPVLDGGIWWQDSQRVLSGWKQVFLAIEHTISSTCSLQPKLGFTWTSKPTAMEIELQFMCNRRIVIKTRTFMESMSICGRGPN